MARSGAGGRAGAAGGARKTSKAPAGPRVGSGGQRRAALEGKKPTPKATERTKHPAARKAKAIERHREAAGPRNPRTPRWADPDSELVGGRNPVLEALRAKIPASALVIALGVDHDERLVESLALARKRGLELIEVPRPDLDHAVHGGPHQGVALQVPPYVYAHPDDLLASIREKTDSPLLVALDGITDPHNLGSIARSAAALGGHGVIVPERRAAGVTAGAWKASAGALARIPVARATNLTRTLKSYADAGLFIIGLTADGDTQLDDLELATDGIVIVVGSEGRGISRLVEEVCDIKLSIPMSGPVESLNAGVAAGVVLAEVARRRRIG
jgi:23S rRNA (guanosine2251-2'-O)-methyltransferase